MPAKSANIFNKLPFLQVPDCTNQIRETSACFRFTEQKERVEIFEYRCTEQKERVEIFEFRCTER